MLLVTIFVCGKSGRSYADYDSEETTLSTTQVCTTKTTTTENSTPTSDISTSKTTSSRTTISDEPTTSRRKDVETTKRTAQETTSKRTTTKDTYINQYTEDDLYVLSHVIYGEAGDCSNEAQRAVGSVVLNRVASSEFPNTIRGVVFQPSQYACTWDGNYYREPSERAVNNAKYLLENGSTLPSCVVYQAQFVQGRGVYAEIDGEIFCY